MMKKNKTRFLTSKKLKEAWKAVSLSIMLMLVVNMSYLGVFFVANEGDNNLPFTNIAQAEQEITGQSDNEWPTCGGFNCTAKDVIVNKIELTDRSNRPLTTCNPGETVDAKIRATITNNANSSRYAFVLMGDIYQGDNKLISLSTAVYSGEVSGKCVKGFIRGGRTETSDIYDFSWICGEPITIKNLNLSWSTVYQTCNDFFLNPECKQRKSQCYSQTEPFEVFSPLVADFSYTTGNICVNDEVSFTDKTSGGEAPYTYSWNFGDSETSTDQNPTHTLQLEIMMFL